MKEFKTLDEQILILKSRGLIIDDELSAKKILELENYYNLINGYCDLFVNKDRVNHSDTYINGATFDEIYKLYLFDKKMKNVFLKRILKLENHFKSTIAHDFSRIHGHKDYLIPSSFEDFSSLPNTNPNKIRIRLRHINELIAKIEKTISDYIPKKDYLRYYNNTHGYIPLWVVINCLNFGNISKFYSLMQNKERIQVSQTFGVSKEKLEVYIKALTEFRNICAHDERLYSYELSQRSEIKNTKYHDQLSIPKNRSSKFLKGKNDLFACVIVFKELLSKEDFDAFFIDVKELIKKLDKNIKSINVDRVIEKMGFPSSWESIYIL